MSRGLRYLCPGRILATRTPRILAVRIKIPSELVPGGFRTVAISLEASTAPRSIAEIRSWPNVLRGHQRISVALVVWYQSRTDIVWNFGPVTGP